MQKKGEEITDGYSGIFCNVPQEDRSQIHTRYHFDCLCKACNENWPMKNELTKQLPNVGKKNKPVTRLKHLMKQKDDKNLTVEGKFEVLKEALILAYEVLKPPHSIICNIESDFYNQLRIMY